MYIDDFLKLSDAQALTATAVGTNVIDLTIERSVGSGEPMAVFFSVGVAADQTTGDEDYTFDVEYAAAADQSTGIEQLVGRRIFESGTPTSPAQDADLLVAGFLFSIPIPPMTAGEVEQFLGVRYTLAGTTPTITVDAWVAPLSMGDQYTSYADNVTIG
ncbi:MAG: hypothetical protein COB69_00185 [Phycisphaera sp.]|nr:MAG: hypothetical protein COB69_00185 [Phycisphaera sp.]